MNKMAKKDSSKKAFSDFIRKCLEEQQDKEFILQIPMRKEVADDEQRIQL
ncbi:MAG: hypothetical protein KH828_06265 [Clostridiales bacterium]|nr:hypothetical protein [Clostridiales bacterium]